MKNQDDIVIPRSELPFVILEGDGNGRRMYPHDDGLVRYEVTEGMAKNLRKWARKYLAVGEAIESVLADEDKKLLSEAMKLHESVSGETGRAWDDAYWTKIARAARELHGK